MKNIRVLSMVSRKFYLGVFLLWVAVLLVDSIYICKDKELILTRTGMETYVEQTLQQENGQNVLKTQCVSLYTSIQDKGSNFCLVGAFFTLFFVVVVLLLKEMAYSDERTREFQRTWPVKCWQRELYDYLMLFGIILGGFLLQTSGLLLAQIKHNHLFLDTLEQRGILYEAKTQMEAQYGEFLLTMCCYVVVLLVAYTWIYLGISVTKNVVLGVILSFVVRYAVYMFFNACATYIIPMGEILNLVEGELMDRIMSCIYEISSSLLYISEFFGNYAPNINADIISFYWDGGEEFHFNLSHWMLFQIVFMLLLFVGIVLSAVRKEMTKGKIFYFSWLDYPFAILMGCSVFALSVDGFLWDLPELAAILAMTVTIVSFLFVHPDLLRKTKCLEVK